MARISESGVENLASYTFTTTTTTTFTTCLYCSQSHSNDRIRAFRCVQGGVEVNEYTRSHTGAIRRTRECAQGPQERASRLSAEVCPSASIGLFIGTHNCKAFVRVLKGRERGILPNRENPVPNPLQKSPAKVLEVSQNLRLNTWLKQVSHQNVCLNRAVYLSSST